MSYRQKHGHPDIYTIYPGGLIVVSTQWSFATVFSTRKQSTFLCTVELTDTVLM